MTPEKRNCALVVSSCDAYSDLWQPFFDLFRRHWQDCQFPVYLVSNSREYPDKKVTTVCLGNAVKAWGQMLRQALSRIPEEYVLLMLEDFFLRRKIDNRGVTAALSTLQEIDGDMLRLHPRPKPDMQVKGFSAIGWIMPGAPYRVSAQASIWKKSALMNLLRDDESIWQFELQGSRRSDTIKGFYCLWKPVLSYDHHVIERGKWFLAEAKLFGSMNIGCDFSRRQVMSGKEMLCWKISMLKGRLIWSIPWQQRERLKNFIRGIKR